MDKAIQRATFRAHVGLAKELKLPVIVHDRGDGQEALDILEEFGAPKTGVIIHGFAKDEAYAKRCEALGIHLSLGLRTLQNPPPGFEAAVKRVPLQFIVTETDSNKPWEVIKACEIIGKIKGVPTGEVGAKATENLMRLTRH